MQEPDTNRATVRRFFDEVFNGKDVAILDELVTDDFICYLGAARLDKEDMRGLTLVREWAERVGGEGPHPRLIIDEMVGAGEFIAVRAHWVDAPPPNWGSTSPEVAQDLGEGKEATSRDQDFYLAFHAIEGGRIKWQWLAGGLNDVAAYTRYRERERAKGRFKGTGGGRQQRKRR